ncbi:hypothetical protein TSAR_006738 [Trichomalopsis sarcophagae]|uniref:DUF4604 domain-containing protein n=1 Tax=Trichomalopsis sarcophagae TaxID=543379 RepID=A0A232F1C3_9HYME|nr:hypothetical protein TSAR_006738 [Trichomalopsis sarcophagae]
MNSKKKQNINFIKPAEPAFITRLKQQAGYVEGPSVDTKREELPKIDDDDDYEDRDDEKPVVVVMKDGDLTEEDADLYAKVKKEFDKIDKADLSQRVIFKRKKEARDESSSETSNPKEVKKKKKEKAKPTKSVLSFNEDEEEE